MNNYPQPVTYKGLDNSPKGYPSAYGLTALDPDVSSWQERIKDYSGESVSDFVLFCVNGFVKDLKINNLWNHLLEVYIFSGVSRASIPVKLKYLPNRPSNLTIPTAWNTYNATGTGAGLSNLGLSYQITTGVLVSDLPARNRSVGAYCTSNTTDGLSTNPYYATIIGRESGGGNSAFGPTPTPTGVLYSRMLDTTNTLTIAPSVSQTGNAGLYITSEGRGTVKQYSQQKITSATVLTGDIKGTSGYVIGGGIGGGNFMWATLSFAYLGLALNDIQLTLLDKIVNKMMTSFQCNVY